MVKYSKELKFLSTCLPSTARLFFQHAPRDFIRSIIDAVWTTLSGKLNLSPNALNEIRSVQPALRRIATRGQPLDQRRRTLSTKSGVHAVQKLFSIIHRHF